MDPNWKDPGIFVALWFFSNLFAVGMWDTWVTFGQLNAGTVSHYVQAWSKSYPVIPFASGMLCGHLFAGITIIKKL